MIRQSVVILLDVHPQKFNVGLEAGYALALGKPIITIRHVPDTESQPRPLLPFDIMTLNCFDYNEELKDKLIETISERVLVALEEAKRR